MQSYMNYLFCVAGRSMFDCPRSRPIKPLIVLQVAMQPSSFIINDKHGSCMHFQAQALLRSFALLNLMHGRADQLQCVSGLCSMIPLVSRGTSYYQASAHCPASSTNPQLPSLWQTAGQGLQRGVGVRHGKSYMRLRSLLHPV